MQTPLLLGGSVFLSRGFVANGEVSLANSRIEGHLECINGIFVNPSGVAFNADAIDVKGRIFLRAGFRAEGEVNLLNAKLGSNLECDGALLVNPSKMALRAEGIRVGGSIFLRNGFKAEGEVNFHCAEIGSNLDCERGTFTNPPKSEALGSGKALNADRVKVAGYVFLRKGVRAKGEVNLLHAEIGSSLECDNSTFENPWCEGLAGSGTALNAEHLKVSGYVFLRNGFRADGTVNLSNSQIGIDLNCSAGTCANDRPGTDEQPTIALSADGSKIHGSILLTDGFSAKGEVWVAGAQVGGQIACDKAKFDGGLVAQATTAESFFWTRLIDPANARLDLVNARVYAIADDSASWPAREKLRVDGFVYQRISGSRTPKTSKERLNWLSRQGKFATQPYTQLAGVLRDSGDDTGARNVLFEMECLKRRQPGIARWSQAWGKILQGTIGFGFYPGRSVTWLVLLVAVCTATYWHGYSAGAFSPTGKAAYEFFSRTKYVQPEYVRFSATTYALENLLPFVRLGQTEHWQPNPEREWRCTGRGTVPSCLASTPSFLRGVRLFEVLLGWFLATMFVAAVTGVVRRD
jgi:sRNA-binding regulator protein Hfq